MSHISMSRLTARGLPLALAMLAACNSGQRSPGLLRGRPFAAVPRQTPAATLNLLRQGLAATGQAAEAGVTTEAGRAELQANVTAATGNESFYLAIRKTELDTQPYFLSAYLTQFAAGEVGYNGVGNSMGTRTVYFKVQNDRLYVMEASNYLQVSPALNPEVIYEAYPLVHDSDAFNEDEEADQYVLIDPSAGLSRFTLASTLFQGNASFSLDASFMQRFRPLADGVSYEQVFTGHADKPLVNYTGLNDMFRASGTLAVSLRRYAVGEGFTRSAGSMFFKTELGYALKWNIHPGMTPIRWTISKDAEKALGIYARFLKPEDRPDVIGAIKRGVESWNQAFGFPVLEAVLGDGTESPGDDDVNFVYYDLRAFPQFAFANFRNNPLTGEARGASVYFNSIWFTYAMAAFQKDPGAVASLAALPPPPAEVHVSWNGMAAQDDGCRLSPMPASLVDENLQAPPPAGDTDLLPTAEAALLATAGLTKRAKVEQYITHVIAHEIGHTLGLRHNFAGSLNATSPSIMDYLDDVDRILTPKPQAYDVQAVKYLYQGALLPTETFCTDGYSFIQGYGAINISECAPFDRGAHPYGDFYVPIWDRARARNMFPAGTARSGLFRFVKFGPDPLAAWNYAWSQVSVVNPPASRIPTHHTWVSILLYDLFLKDPLEPFSPNAAFRLQLEPASPLGKAMLAELQAQLTDAAGLPANRRWVVDILKNGQSLPAMQALVDARAALVAQQAGATGDAALTASELITRIDLALTPYFK